jgi:hypothetical protein
MNDWKETIGDLFGAIALFATGYGLMLLAFGFGF